MKSSTCNLLQHCASRPTFHQRSRTITWSTIISSGSGIGSIAAE